MMNDFFILMKQELVVIVIIFILLFIKLGNTQMKNESFLTVINVLLLLNVVSGFFFSASGKLFGDMFVTNDLLRFEKNVLSLGTLIISLQSHNWLKQHQHAPEFYMLMLSTLFGMFLMISSNKINTKRRNKF